MGYGDGSSIIGPEATFQFNRMLRDKVVMQWRKKAPGINTLTGAPLEGDEHEGEFKNLKRWDGKNMEVDFNGSPRTLTGVDDGSAERATISLEGLDDLTGQEFPVAHYVDKIPIEESKMTRYDQSETGKTKFWDWVFELASASIEDTLERALWATGANKSPARTRLGSIIHAVSDGVSTGETDYVSYGTINRADAENVEFRAYVDSVPVLSREKVGLAQMTVDANKGMTRAVMSPLAPHNRMRQLVEGMLDAEIDGAYMDFARSKFRYAGMTFMLAPYAPAGHMIGLDPDGWETVGQDQKPMSRQGVVYDPSRVATYVLPLDVWFQSICVDANKQWKLRDIAG